MSGLLILIAIIGISLATITTLTPTKNVKVNQVAIQASNQTKDTQIMHDTYNYYAYEDDYHGYYGYNYDNGYGLPDYRSIKVQPTIAPNNNYIYHYADNSTYFDKSSNTR